MGLQNSAYQFAVSHSTPNPNARTYDLPSVWWNSFTASSTRWGLLQHQVQLPSCLFSPKMMMLSAGGEDSLQTILCLRSLELMRQLLSDFHSDCREDLTDLRASTFQVDG